ncbi:MAG: zinc-ribbon domain-containing protein [Lachnospiraceae bacterium]|nr:zinc-ribbon domain-containing protein [Lachnospiraceae bacterium]
MKCCIKCGKQIEDNAHFCQYCGESQVLTEAPIYSHVEGCSDAADSVIQPMVQPTEPEQTGKMKKYVFNSILSVVIIIAIVAFGCFFHCYGNEAQESLDATLYEVESEGHGALMEMTVLFLGGFAVAAIYAVGACAFFFGFLIFSNACIAHFLYEPRKGRIIAYRVFKTLEYIFQVIVIFLLLLLTFEEGFHVIFLIMAIAFAVLNVLSMRNTYSKRIWS